MKKLTLAAITQQYSAIQYNADNYTIGGGLDGSKFASNRHEDAKYDPGKRTLGEATQLFKKATDMDTDAVREVIEFAVPHMEWHHAGKLPKSYGGGMKKTYFLNAKQIADIAENWYALESKLAQSKIEAKEREERKLQLERAKAEFLQANAKRFTRVQQLPAYCIVTLREMNGKHGWFDSTYKSYNLPEYYSGWEFESRELIDQYANITLPLEIIY